MNAPTKTEDVRFIRLIHRNHMWGLWEIASQMTPHPRPQAVPYQWKWSLLEEVVKQSASAVPVGDERRAMQLFNPGLNGQWATTNTLIAAVQVLLPGEVARAHRHTPAAIRFIMSGNGAYTAVEGEKVIMREGDLVLTPSWQWHDHGNETGETVVWMDGLDVPLTKALDCIFFQMHQNLKADHGQAGERLQGALRPRAPRADLGQGAAAVLAADALFLRPDHGGAGCPALHRGIALRRHRARIHESADRRAGDADHLLPHPDAAQGREAEGAPGHWQLGLPRGARQGPHAHRRQALRLEQGDIIALPSWAQHAHENTGGEDAILFSISDRPVIEALGFYREETAAESYAARSRRRLDHRQVDELAFQGAPRASRSFERAEQRPASSQPLRRRREAALDRLDLVRWMQLALKPSARRAPRRARAGGPPTRTGPPSMGEASWAMRDTRNEPASAQSSASSSPWMPASSWKSN